MERKNKSIVWTGFNDEEFINIVKTSKSKKEICERLGLSYKGRNYSTVNRRIDKLNVDISHLNKNYDKMRYINISNRKGLEEICIENSTYNRGQLKKRLLNLGILKNKCYICGQEPFWNGKPMVLIIDHINGVSNDNRIENLRMVCPNCNSQLDTHCGKKKNFCECGKTIKVGNKYCKECLEKHQKSDKLNLRKVERPTKEVLESEIKNANFSAVGRKYGVSGNSVKKWAKRYEII